MADRRIEVGRVAGIHGTAGRIRVKPFSNDPSGIASVRTVRLSAEGGSGAKRVGDFEVRAAGRQGGCAVLSLRGIDSPEAAKEWSGAFVSVLRRELPPPEEGEYYVTDLVGCEVVDIAGARIGELAGVEEGPAHDWLAVRRGEGESLLPMVSEFVREVDLEGRRIVVAPPEGW